MDKFSSKCARKPTKQSLVAGKKAASVISKKIQVLPISTQAKDALTKVVMNQSVIDITKLLKISNQSVTLCGRINVKNYEGTDEVIIKVFSNADKIKENFYAYSKNIHNEKKPEVTNPYPQHIETDSGYIRENIVIAVSGNVAFMKMFKGGKTIEQMIKSFPDKRNVFYNELLELYREVKSRDYRLWQNAACSIKNILWHNGKWILLSTNCDSTEYCYHKERGLENLVSIIELFRSYGMSDDDLRIGLEENVKKSRYVFPHETEKNAFYDKYFSA